MANQSKVVSRDVSVHLHYVYVKGFRDDVGGTYDSASLTLFESINESLHSLISWEVNLIIFNATMTGRDTWTRIYDHVDVVVNVTERLDDGSVIIQPLTAVTHDEESLFGENGLATVKEDR